MHRSIWIAVALAGFAFALFLPALQCQFLNFDDPAYATENWHVKGGLTVANILWAFKSSTAGNWHPVTMLSHMFDCQIYGLRPWGHHLTNIVLHALNTALVFLVLLRLTGAMMRSACVAALFAVHPVHVESVAWIAERKDVLCAFFFLWAIWVYIGYARTESKKAYWGSVMLFALALMSKPMAVTLPFVLLLLDFWPLNRRVFVSWSRLIFEKWAFFLLTGAFCLVTLATQKVAQSVAQMPFWQGVNHALVSYVNYTRVVVFPWHLSAFYPYQKHEPAWQGMAAAAVVALLTWTLARQRAKRPFLLMGWLWFLGTLVPVAGIVQVGSQSWADRYDYIPSIGFFTALVWLAAEWAMRERYLTLLAPFLVGILSFATVKELSYWKTAGTLFHRAAQLAPHNSTALALEAGYDEEQGKPDAAIRLCREVIKIEPNYQEAHYTLGRALEDKGDWTNALAEYHEAVRLQTNMAGARIAAGMLLARMKRDNEAMAEYSAALNIDPDSPQAESNWGALLLTEKRWTESIPHLKTALKLAPDLIEARCDLGIAELQLGQTADGIAELRTAFAQSPTNLGAQLNLGLGFNQVEDWPSGAALLQPIAARETTNVVAQYQYALAAEHLGNVPEAVKYYDAALRIDPDLIDALQRRAWIAATDADPKMRDGTLAVQLATRACNLTRNERPALLLTLAAAQAEAGDFDAAVNAATRAKTLARNDQLAAGAERFRVLFAGHHAFHGQGN